MLSRKRWPRLGLGTRIAITVVAALLAIDAIYAVLFVLMPARLLTTYSAHWLIMKTEEASSLILQADTQERDALADRFGEDNNLQVSWRRTWDEPGTETKKPLRPFMERVRASITRDLGGKVRKTAVKGALDLQGNILKVDVKPYPPDFINKLPTGPLEPGDADLAVLGIFELAIQGLDGSWIIIRPKGTQGYAERLQPWLILLTVAVAVISVFSAIAARNTLRPLQRLTESARQFGRTRKADPIDPAGLHEFAVVAQAMNDMQDSIKRFIDERTQMLAALSHDLRTSLTTLRFDAEEVAGDGKNRLVAGMEDMERVISATLTFAGNDLKSEQTQLIDLASLLISLCDSFIDRGCDVSYSGPDHLFAVCQPMATKRAFTNVIDNAVKYGGCARVLLHHSADAATISIQDDGPGVPPEKTDLAFRPFGRLDYARNRETGGVGLGLTIARDVIQSHGGEIRLGAPPHGKGLEVSISLPLPPSHKG
jgi:signal transduction histidine kinase